MGESDVVYGEGVIAEQDIKHDCLSVCEGKGYHDYFSFISLFLFHRAEDWYGSISCIHKDW